MDIKTNEKNSTVWLNRLIFMCLIIFSSSLSAYSQTTLKERLEHHVYTLASDSMRGRRAGTEYARKAVEYIVNQFMEIGIEPYFGDTYLQHFFGNSRYQNVVGIIHGSDPVLKDEYIVIGAHYDGIGTLFGKIRNGADDNASGVATLIEIGRELQQYQSDLKRSIILIAFDHEENGVWGSMHFITNWEKPLENIKLMIGVDMVGHYEANGRIRYIGSGTIQNGSEIILTPYIIPAGLNVETRKFERSIIAATDTYPFAAKKIPTFFLTTGLKSPYHTSRDEAHLIDYNGMTLITEHLVDLIKNISKDEYFDSSGKIARKHLRNRVELGVSFNYGSTLLGAGLVSQVNFGIFAIRPELQYNYNFIAHSLGTISTNNLTIPLNLVLQTPSTWLLGGDLFFGGYYSYRFNGSQGGKPIDFDNTFNRGDFGLNFGLSMITRPLRYEYGFRLPLTDFTQSSNIFNGHIRKNTFYISLNYIF